MHELTHTYTITHTYTHACMHGHTHKRARGIAIPTQSHTHYHTHTYTHARMHGHTHKHTHIRFQINSIPLLNMNSGSPVHKFWIFLRFPEGWCPVVVPHRKDRTHRRPGSLDFPTAGDRIRHRRITVIILHASNRFAYAPLSYFQISDRGRKEMFYLTTHATHFIYGLYGVGLTVKDHSDSEREETRCRHKCYSFRLAARVILYASLSDKITHTTTFVTPVVEHWLEREIAQWVHHEGSTRRPIAP